MPDSPLPQTWHEYAECEQVFTDTFGYHHDGLALATDDPVPVDCPFCGGDPILHARRINAIAYVSAKFAYRVFDDSMF